MKETFHVQELSLWWNLQEVTLYEVQYAWGDYIYNV
jgi:hypothetical protein